MTSFPLLVCCHSAVNVISCLSNYVQTQPVSAAPRSTTAVSWDSEETLGLFALSAAAFNGTIFWIISRLRLHFFIQSFYVLAARGAWGKSPWYSWLFHLCSKCGAQMVSVGPGPGWKGSCRFSLSLKMVPEFNWNARSWTNKGKMSRNTAWGLLSDCSNTVN